MNEEKPEELIEVERVLVKLKEKFQPVTSLEESNHTMSTLDFCEKIRSHYPGGKYVGDDEIYKLLIEHNYTYSMIGLEMEWLVKKV